MSTPTTRGSLARSSWPARRRAPSRRRRRRGATQPAARLGSGGGRPAPALPPAPRSSPRRWPPAGAVPPRQAFPLGTPGRPSAPSRGLRPEPGQNLVQHARELIGHLATLPLVALGLGPEPLDLVAELVALALDGLHATLQASVLVDHAADRPEIFLHGLHGPAYALQGFRGGVGVEGDDRGHRKHGGCG